MPEESPCKHCETWIPTKPCNESIDCLKRLAYVNDFCTQIPDMDRPVRMGPKPTALPKKKRGRPRVKRPPGKYVNTFINSEVQKKIKIYCKANGINFREFIEQAALEKINGGSE